MYNIDYDASNNRIYVNLEGSIKADEVKEFEREILKLVYRTNYPTILVDARKLKIMNDNTLSEFERVNKHGLRKKIKKIAFVSENLVVLEQINKIIESEEGMVKEKTFDSILNAEAFLDKVD